jgi:hypothetical protein
MVACSSLGIAPSGKAALIVIAPVSTAFNFGRSFALDFVYLRNCINAPI